jgi:hypothetical protein
MRYLLWHCCLWIGLALLVGCRPTTLEGTIVVGQPVAGLTVMVAPEQDLAPYLAKVRAKTAPAFAALRDDYAEANRAMVGHGFDQVEPRIFAKVEDIEIWEPVRTEDTAYWYFTYEPGRHTAKEAEALVDKTLMEKGELGANGVATYHPLPKVDRVVDMRPRVAAARTHLEDWEAKAFADFPAGPGMTTVTDAAGHFKLTVPRTGRLVLVARGTVTLEGRPQQRTWAIWVPLAGPRPKTLQLSAQDLIFSDPPRSLVHGD